MLAEVDSQSEASGGTPDCLMASCLTAGRPVVELYDLRGIIRHGGINYQSTNLFEQCCQQSTTQNPMGIHLECLPNASWMMRA
jgi:hypothetical protein